MASDSASAAAASVPAPVEPAPSFLDTLASLYFSPREGFTRALKKSFWPALLGIIVFNLAFTAVWVNKVNVKEFMEAQIEESPRAQNMPPEQKERVVEMQSRFVPVFAWVAAVVFPLLTFAVLAAVFLLVFRFFYGAEVTFRQSLTVVCWAMFAWTLVHGTLTLLVLWLKGDWTINPEMALQASPALLVERGTVARPLYVLLNSLDLFSFWLLALFSAGFGVASRRSTGAAATGVVVLWALYVLVKVGWTAAFGG